MWEETGIPVENLQGRDINRQPKLTYGNAENQTLATVETDKCNDHGKQQKTTGIAHFLAHFYKSNEEIVQKNAA